jgi:uncharacterized RDD family membrane protein YckC
MQHGRVAAAEPASIFLRAAAFLLDWAIVLLLSAFIATSLSDALAAIIFLSGLAAYHIGFTAATGATPGKMAMRIQVTDPRGNRLAPDKAILRHLVLFLSVLPFGAGLALSAVLAVSDPRQRTLHDRIAESVVVKVAPER